MAKETFSFTIKDYSADILRELAKAVETGMLSIGEKANGHAVKTVPVDTGLLKNSITYGLDGGETHITSYRADPDKGDGRGSYSGTFEKAPEGQRVLYLGSNVHYAEAVETLDRHHKVGGAHFLKNAMANHTDEYKNTLKAALEAAKG